MVNYEFGHDVSERIVKRRLYGNFEDFGPEIEAEVTEHNFYFRRGDGKKEYFSWRSINQIWKLIIEKLHKETEPVELSINPSVSPENHSSLFKKETLDKIVEIYNRQFR